ncbi:MAG: PEP-CTERM sorting domain-containing protein [Proteobacteria bacterium]|nr:PEP-CTERM sorting domain-containing protein [Pseudomonadota bacterium]
MRKLSRWLSGPLLAVVCLAFAGPTGAVSFGPLAVVAPSAIVPDVGPTEMLSGSITLSVASVPVLSPTLFSLTNVSVLGSGGASFALDPSVLSPALGVVQATGNFLIPTLFLHIVDGALNFDLAVPNVAGKLFFGAGGSVVGIASSFEIDSLSPAGILTVNLLAGVPEPGTALLLTLGIAALGMRVPKEISR